MVTDAEVVTLCVAQAIMGIPSDRRFLRGGSASGLRICSRSCPASRGYFKRRRRLADTIEWLMGVFASQSPGYHDDLLLIDSTPVECARSRETVKRSRWATLPTTAAARSHSPLLLGLPAARDLRPGRHPTSARRWPRPNATSARSGSNCSPAATATAAKRLLGDKGYAGREFAHAVSDLDATIVRPRRKDEPGHGPHLAPIRQRIESIFWTCKDLLTLERHGARTLDGIKERILQRFLCLAACITLNHQLGRPSRALVDYVA